jgi:plasmid stabilization system protein ParE
MKKIVWTDDAQADMEAIYEFYVGKNPTAATHIYNGILEDADILMTFPEIAAKEPLLEGMEFIFRSLVTHLRIYKIIYFTDENNVVITHVWDCRRNPASFPPRIF